MNAWIDPEIGERIWMDGALWEVVDRASTRWGSPTARVRKRASDEERWLPGRGRAKPAKWIDDASIQHFVREFRAEGSDFDRWLGLLGRPLGEVYTEPMASEVHSSAERIAERLRAALGAEPRKPVACA